MLELPSLHDKRFPDFLQQLLERIPAISPGWTNYNPSDPGIAILELLSWIADATLYKIDQIPHNVYQRFLYLVIGRRLAQLSELVALPAHPDPPYLEFARFVAGQFGLFVPGQVSPDALVAWLGSSEARDQFELRRRSEILLYLYQVRSEVETTIPVPLDLELSLLNDLNDWLLNPFFHHCLPQDFCDEHPEAIAAIDNLLVSKKIEDLSQCKVDEEMQWDLIAANRHLLRLYRPQTIPEWQPAALTTIKAATIRYLQSSYAAATEEDIATLAYQSTAWACHREYLFEFSEKIAYSKNAGDSCRIVDSQSEFKQLANIFQQNYRPLPELSLIVVGPKRTETTLELFYVVTPSDQVYEIYNQGNDRYQVYRQLMPQCFHFDTKPGEDDCWWNIAVFISAEAFDRLYVDDNSGDLSIEEKQKIRRGEYGKIYLYGDEPNYLEKNLKDQPEKIIKQVLARQWLAPVEKMSKLNVNKYFDPVGKQYYRWKSSGNKYFLQVKYWPWTLNSHSHYQSAQNGEQNIFYWTANSQQPYYCFEIIPQIRRVEIELSSKPDVNIDVYFFCDHHLTYSNSISTNLEQYLLKRKLLCYEIKPQSWRKIQITLTYKQEPKLEEKTKIVTFLQQKLHPLIGDSTLSLRCPSKLEVESMLQQIAPQYAVKKVERSNNNQKIPIVVIWVQTTD